MHIYINALVCRPLGNRAEIEKKRIKIAKQLPTTGGRSKFTDGFHLNSLPAKCRHMRAVQTKEQSPEAALACAH
jgi:hypothetical protein